MIRNVFKQTADNRGLTISEMTRMTGLDRSVVHRIYHSKTNAINFETLDALCKGLDMQVIDIVLYIPDDKKTIDDIIQLEDRGAIKKKKTSEQ